MDWVIEEHVIYLIIDDSKIFIDASNLFKAKSNQLFSYNNSKFSSPIDALGIRLSNISLKPNFILNIMNKQIFLTSCVFFHENEYYLKMIGSCYPDYLIINNVVYYLGNQMSELIEELVKLDIKIDSVLSLSKYIDLIKILRYMDFPFVDNVNQLIKKNNEQLIYNIDGFNGRLFDYQTVGFRWLSYMTENGCGTILADEMGLGKTLQIIALLGHLKDVHSCEHFLVVAPVTILENWRREILKFYPTLSVVVHKGPHRVGYYKYLLDFNVVLTSYSTLQLDFALFSMIKWDVFVVDEAQNIKNPNALRTLAIKQIPKRVAIAVTGTPFENHLTDLWSLIDFINPKYLGTLKDFENNYFDNVPDAESLDSIISPFMLRRRVLEVAKDLPQRFDIPQPIEMNDDEADLYEQGRKEVICEAGKVAMNKIQKLRLFCTHPLVYNSSIVCSDPTLISAKYTRLCELLEEIISDKEKVLVFTSFTKMIDILLHDLKTRFRVPIQYINGSVAVDKRQIIIDSFSNMIGPAILILNPRAAGAGLNITAANHVIHYNLEWNPSLEDQASARAYRRGQDKPVFIYRLYYINTIDEIMNDRIAMKRDLSNAAVVGNKGILDDAADLIKALELSPKTGGNYDQ